MGINKKLSLAELMGKTAASRGQHGLTLESLPDILGESMPDLPKNPVGRHRLIRALQQRFGLNFRSLPGVKDLVEEFDREIDFEKKVASLGLIKYRRSDNG